MIVAQLPLNSIGGYFQIRKRYEKNVKLRQAKKSVPIFQMKTGTTVYMSKFDGVGRVLSFLCSS